MRWIWSQVLRTLTAIDALQRAKNQVAHEVRSAINPDAVRELIESIERDLAEAQTRTAADGS